MSAFTFFHWTYHFQFYWEFYLYTLLGIFCLICVYKMVRQKRHAIVLEVFLALLLVYCFAVAFIAYKSS